MRYSGRIIVLAYPDTFVTMSDEWICKFLPMVGLGTRDYIKAGHAALILINNENGEAQYFDFGRYVTPPAHGRVRNAMTDAELRLGFQAEFNASNHLRNLEEFLLWLDANPQKTHGKGRLLASVCEHIDHDSALSYMTGLQQQGSIPYGAFHKTGSNCSRFVTDTILSATSNKKIRNGLMFNKRFTPSTVGNVEKAALGPIYEVYGGKIEYFTSTAFRENLKNYFHKRKGTPEADEVTALPGPSEEAQLLTGIGSNAWFEYVASDLPQDHFRIKRFNESHEVDFDGVYQSDLFDPAQDFSFTYDSHCAYCHVIQNGIKIKLSAVTTYREFNSSRKAHSA